MARDSSDLLRDLVKALAREIATEIVALAHGSDGGEARQPLPATMTQAEAAKWLSMSPNTVCNLVNAGVLPSVTFPGYTRKHVYVLGVQGLLAELASTTHPQRPHVVPFSTTTSETARKRSRNR